MRIAFFTSGRFHLCEIAREFSLRGHDVRFYSLVPPWRTRQFGLPASCNRWLLPYVAPWFAAERLLRRTRAGEAAAHAATRALDCVAAWKLEPCDVFIGMSGLSNRVAAVAKLRYRATVFIERCSRHVHSQRDILAGIPGAEPVPDYAVSRELRDYEVADVVNVPSAHCERSFLERGFPPERLSRNPFGVSLAQFAVTPAPPAEPPTIVMTGTWCLRKGCDTLVEAWRRLSGVKLLHVGPVTDCPLPADEGFTHYDKVDQAVLRDYYGRAHVFALASREEGLAFVLPQALACGLRIVCTTTTGGEDLLPYITDPRAIRVVPPDDPTALADALRHALAEATAETGPRKRLTHNAAKDLTWSAYADRYLAILDSFRAAEARRKITSVGREAVLLSHAAKK